MTPARSPATSKAGRIIALVLGGLVLLLAGLYLTLAHTVVGRNALQAEVEDWFSSAFEGHLTIGSVTGNLRRDVIMSDVRLLDGQDSLWLQIGDIRLRPRWRSIVARKLHVGTLTIQNAELRLRYRADSTWNLNELLVPSRSEREQWQFESGRIIIRDVDVTASFEDHAPPAVSAGWLFDLESVPTHISSADLNAVWRPGNRRFELESLQASWPTLGATVENASGTVFMHEDIWHLATLRAQTRQGHLALVATLNTDPLRVGVEVVDARLEPALITAFVPRLSLPDQLVLSGRGSAAAGAGEIETLRARMGASTLELEAAELLAEPDTLYAELRIADARFRPSELAAALPSIAWPPQALQMNGRIHARVASGFRRLDSDLQIESPLGSGSAVVSVIRDSVWSYRAELAGSGVDPGAVLESPAWTGSLNGTMHASGSEAGLRSTALALAPSSLAGWPLDTLVADARWTGDLWTASGYVASGTASVSAHIGAVESGQYEARGILRRLDLGDFLPSAPLRTAVNASWSYEGGMPGTASTPSVVWLEVDSSEVTYNGRTRLAPPHQWEIRVDDTISRIDLDGDLLALTAESSQELPATGRVGRTWLQAARLVANQIADNRRGQESVTRSIPDEISGLANAAQAAMRSADADSIRLDVKWTLKAHEAWNAIVPMLPATRSAMQGVLSARTDGTKLGIEVSLTDELLQSGQMHLEGASLQLSALARLDSPAMDIRGAAGAETLTVGGLVVAAPHVRVNQAGSSGAIVALAGKHEHLGPGRIEVTYEVLPDRIGLTVEDAEFQLGGAPWQTVTAAQSDLFADALVVNGLALQAPGHRAGSLQQLAVQGAVSATQQDTINVDLTGLELSRLSELLEFRRSIGGLLDAEVRWTSLERPELTGFIRVDTLTLEDRVIGLLSAESRIVSDDPDARIRLSVDPVERAPEGLIDAHNQFSLEGRIRLPGPQADGRMDLQLDVERWDAGFIEELLPNLDSIEGGLTGGARIYGSPLSPELDGRFSIDDGSFALPRYHTFYAATADLRLTTEGILLDHLLLTDDGGGFAHVDGLLGFNDYRFLSFDAQVRADALEIMSVPQFTRDLSFYGSIRTSGNAFLTGPVDGAFLRSTNLAITPESVIDIPIRDNAVGSDPGFIIYADSSSGTDEQIRQIRTRSNILDRRPEGQRSFATGLDMDLNIEGPAGSTLRLVIDPLLGDVINAVGDARVQLERQGGDIATFGTFDIASGDYLFTAGEVFVRRFQINQGTITWSGDPLNPTLDIAADYRTRASRSGLPADVGGSLRSSLPIIVDLHITGELNAVNVALSLRLDQRQEPISDTPLLESYLNRPDLAAEHATSVLLTNSFVLSAEGSGSGVLAGSAFNSVSSLVSSQLNRYLSQVVPNADFTLGVQSDETAADLDVSAGIALRLLDERLQIRGHGIYRGLSADEQAATQGLEGEFIVELQLSPTVTLEVFHRRESDVLSETLITRETGVGLNYRTEFTTWRRLWDRLTKRNTSTAQNK